MGLLAPLDHLTDGHYPRRQQQLAQFSELFLPPVRDCRDAVRTLASASGFDAIRALVCGGGASVSALRQQL